jgi:DNA-binding transcriptional LysR family regulator
MHMLDWDNLRIFLAVMRDRSLLGAAKKLGIDHTTAARRLSALETAVGARLFDRSPRGVEPTAAGLSLLVHVENIECDVVAATTQIAARDAEVSGTVRLSTPEAFGTVFVAPAIHRLHARHPRLQVELAPESRAVSLSKREADIAIALRQPPGGRLVARRLIDYRLGLYASRAYLKGKASVTDVAMLGDHPFVGYIDELIDLPDLRYLEQVAPAARTAFRSSSIAAQQAAVAAGLGLGVLHVFTAEQDNRLVRLMADEIEVMRSYWLIFHADQQRLPRVRAVIDFLDELVRDNRASF